MSRITAQLLQQLPGGSLDVRWVLSYPRCQVGFSLLLADSSGAKCFRDFLISQTTKKPPPSSRPTLPPRSTLKTFTYTYRGPPPTTTTTTTTTTTSIWYNLAPPTTVNPSLVEDHTYYPVAHDMGETMEQMSMMGDDAEESDYPDAVSSPWPVIDNEDKVGK